MNYWIWSYIILIPTIIFLIPPEMVRWKRVAVILFALAICYVLMNLSVHLKWHLIAEKVNAMPNPTDKDFRRASADGANKIFTLLFGWVPSSIYTGWHLTLWRIYHKKFSKKIPTDYKNDILSIILIPFSIIIFIALVILRLLVLYDSSPTNLNF